MCSLRRASERRAVRAWAGAGLEGLALFVALGCQSSGDGTTRAETGPDAEASAASACGGRATLEPGEVALSEAGHHFEITGWERLRVGDNTWEVLLRGADGAGLELPPDQIDVVLFMPDHGHGTAVAVGVEPLGDGQYRFAPVNLRMPGYWQVSVHFALPGADAATDLVQFAVCVE